MEERKIEISLEEYKRLLNQNARVEILTHFLKCEKYMNTSELKTILGIELEDK